MAKVKLKKTVEKSDNTSVKKPIIKEVGPSYKYMGATKKGMASMGDVQINGRPTSKDSAEYLRGYNYGLSKVLSSSKSETGGEYKKGIDKVGVSGRYNEGFSEGKDKALNKKQNKK